MGIITCSVKILFLLVNHFCGLIGVGIFCAGIYINHKGFTFRDFISTEMSSTSFMMMSLGAGMVVLAFIGCCGAMRNNITLMTIYGVAFLAILMVQMILVGVMIRNLSQEEENVKNVFATKFSNYTEENRPFVNAVQTKLQCCGINGPQDWAGNQEAKASCCLVVVNDLKNCPKEIRLPGCKEVVRELVRDVFSVLVILAIVIGVAEILGVIFAIILIHSSKK